MPVTCSRSLSRRALLQRAAAAVPLLEGALLSPAAGPAAAAAPGGSPHSRGPNRSGILEERLTLRAGGPAKLWEAQVGHGNASLAIAGGRVYTISSAQGVSCLDAATGRPLWKKSIETHFGD